MLRARLEMSKITLDPTPQEPEKTPTGRKKNDRTTVS
jgi:hypothetical protein